MTLVYEESDEPVEVRQTALKRAYAVLFNAMYRDGVMYRQQKHAVDN